VENQTDSQGAGVLVLQGEAEGPELVQPGGDTALGASYSSPQYLQGGHQRDGARLFAAARGRRMTDHGYKLN